MPKDDSMYGDDSLDEVLKAEMEEKLKFVSDVIQVLYKKEDKTEFSSNLHKKK